MSLITETAIANKALQRVGADEIADGEIWTEISRNAKEIRKTYDISRRFELRRNVWRFAIRTQILRSLDTDTRRVTFPDWADDDDYVMNDVVVADGQIWMAKKDMNAPSADPADHDFTSWGNYFGNLVAHEWDEDTTYMSGELVYVAAQVYISLQNTNTDNLVSDTDFWQPLAGTLSSVSFIYPIGAGPSSNTQTRNVFMLPYGYLREAPQDPKAGAMTPLGAPTNLLYSDWYYESDYFTSVMVGPIPYRFVADIEDPAAWDPMFVSGFSCALALEVCEPLTQSTAKMGQVGNQYIKFMTEARTVNGIEQGPVEQPLDSYLSCRF